MKRIAHPEAISDGILKDQLSCSLIVVDGHLDPSQDASLILNQSRDAGSTPLQLARRRKYVIGVRQSRSLTAWTPRHVFDDGTCRSVPKRIIDCESYRSALGAIQSYRYLGQSIAQ